jgi:hypothetical protein
VKHSVDDQEDALLNPIPNVVDVVIPLRNLQLGRDPNTKDADVDESESNCCYPSDLNGISSIDHKERNSVDDDAANALNLYDPEKDYYTKLVEAGSFEVLGICHTQSKEDPKTKKFMGQQSFVSSSNT